MAVALSDGSLLIDEAGGLAAYNVSAQISSQNNPITGLRVVFYPHEVTDGFIGHGDRDGLKGSLVMTNVTVSKGTLPSDQVGIQNHDGWDAAHTKLCSKGLPAWRPSPGFKA